MRTQTEINDHEYSTAHIGFGSFLHFVLGPDAHLATAVDASHRVTFSFNDSDGKCRELADAFFSPQGAIVNDARALLESNRDVKWTIRLAESKAGLWQREE